MIEAKIREEKNARPRFTVFMQLLYKTPNGENPRGLYRIYFCAHPAEYGETMRKIVPDILSAASCAVWYKSAPEENVPADLLSSFNLIVVGVTHRFLTEENIARDRELRYAAEHNIPLLPIMDSVGMEAEYEKYFGRRQYLVDIETGNGEIEYKDKLKLYFSERVASAALIEKVIANFDATVFLSYRKKDRLAARRLIDAIHADESLRHIAIWYDEYLSPGEDFSDSIEQALDKSTLFILAVTRSMVEEDNYVSRVEFPLAQKKKKSILPVALETVDALLLNQRFPDLPPLKEADRASLAKSLTEILGESPGL